MVVVVVDDFDVRNPNRVFFSAEDEALYRKLQEQKKQNLIRYSRAKPMTSYIECILIESGEFHEDIHLQIPSLSLDRYFDSYLLLTEDSTRPEKPYDKVREILTTILNWWIESIENLKDENTIFLPIDFSDGYIGCLSVERVQKTKLKIQYGITQKIRGIDISPSFVKDFVIGEEDFLPYSIVDIVDASNFISCIRSIIGRLK